MSVQRRRVKQVSGGEDSSQDNFSSSEQQKQTTSHKIAYDPQDGLLSAAENKEPTLTLMEEVILMGIKDKEGYLSFWNDNISYALRGCIILELAFRGKIAMVDDPSRKRFELSERLIQVVDDSKTGEALLDETLTIMKNDPQHLSVINWIDLLSGETWNLMKINYQLKQVRERLAKGLVDKGVLRTERKNFLIFDMPTHPLSDIAAKDDVMKRILNLLTSRAVSIRATNKFPEEVKFRTLRSISLVIGSYAANVLENVLNSLGYDERDRAFARADELLQEFSEFPFRVSQGKLGLGVNLQELINEELEANGKGSELQLECIAAVISVFARMDSIL
ncbi:hypothetical protein WICPIJ_004459 [Wickerhamomyces pijperi]|uniref:Vacuolar protein sorting-associated protein 74 n=1 Tax=Wickerhamomyces pijperi TaxID=599730 RepID=A0A9P8Q824_WICPI|nr:hypothetical protein WICPIJ_004459 [Wickerhamomyces pijperi]